MNISCPLPYNDVSDIIHKYENITVTQHPYDDEICTLVLSRSAKLSDVMRSLESLSTELDLQITYDGDHLRLLRADSQPMDM